MDNLKAKKIILLVTYDHGGAGEYIYKIAGILKNLGHQVILVVKEKTKNEDFIITIKTKSLKKISIFSKILEKTNKKKYKIKLDNKYHFYGKDEDSISISPEKVFEQIGFIPDYIFAGWTAGFLNSKDILLLQQYSRAKVYTVTVDMNHFTGGCHYAWDCKGYISGCSDNCPAILNTYFKDLAKTNFENKLKNAQLGNFEIIAGSSWTLKQAEQSKIYKNQEKIININSLIDTNVMQPMGKKKAKVFFNLDSDKFYILMGCQNGNELRKGFDYLLESLKILYNELDKSKDKINVILVSSQPILEQDQIPFNTTNLDYVKDYNKLSLLYQAVDVFVNSSIEDSGPMMVSEALACGTPVVGFDMGVVNNMVITGYNGYKAILKDPDDLAKGIKEIFYLSTEQYSTYSKNSVTQIQKYSSLEYAATLFKSLLSE